MQFNKEEWRFTGRWIQPTLSESFWDEWSQNNEKFPFDFPRIEGKFVGFHGYYFLKKNDVETIKKFLKDNAGNFELLDVFIKWTENIHDKCFNEIHKSYDNLVDALKNIKKLNNDNVNTWVFLMTVGDILIEVCEDVHPQAEFILSYTQPLKDSFMIKQFREASQIHNELEKKSIISKNIEEVEKQDSKLAGRIKEHIKRFEFTGMHHFVGSPYSLFQFFDFKPSSKNELVEENIPEVPEELKWWAKLMSIASWARTDMAETSDYMQLITKPIFMKVNDVLGLEEHEYLWLNIDELIEGVENPSEFKRPNIEKRREKCGVISENGKLIVIEGDDNDSYIKQLMPEKKNISFPLKGRVASKGIARGKAKIVQRPEEIEKIEEGDILVAPETTPDFIVGMKKAVGIITNRGGITSHAAIVSREFGIPCIVGVEGATEVIKDNDLIELNADKGEVRKL
ncbi:MAG: PEP-utilizing enzyme [Candidatus Woesearchaeota archaeon]